MSNKKNKIIALVITIFLGIFSRAIQLNNVFWDKYAGDMLYAIMIYILLNIIFNKIRKINIGIIAFFLLCFLEIFQITNIPLKLIHSPQLLFKILGILLGSTFSFIDIFFYLLGIVSILLMDHFFPYLTQHTK